MVCYDMMIFGRDATIWKILESEGAKQSKNAFKIVKIKFLAMYITNQ